MRYPLTLTATFRKGSANESRMAAVPLTVYPNPTDGLLHVENLPEGDYEGGVFDLQGRQLIPLHVQGGATLEIPVARLTKGTYIVKLTAADGQVRMAKFQKM
ncbi:MAG: T9SS type A sorting domain-containing protein [Bacteroidales bacterium]|nr:T9SS type A sorting domain-containing protein [Bacteroidales bacterium]